MKQQSGFTLIELLVAMGIISILAAIAVPQFIQHRIAGFDARAKTDLHNVATAEEAYYTDYERYLPCDQTDCVTLLPSIRGLPSPGVLLQINVVSATANTFTGMAKHVSSSRIFLWDSATGGLQP